MFPSSKSIEKGIIISKYKYILHGDTITPHISAKKDDIAKVAITPGDPLRAKWIAENFSKEIVEENSVRGMREYRRT